MVGHGGSSASSYLADPTSPITSHCASIVATNTVRVNMSYIHPASNDINFTFHTLNKMTALWVLHHPCNNLFLYVLSIICPVRMPHCALKYHHLFYLWLYFSINTHVRKCNTGPEYCTAQKSQYPPGNHHLGNSKNVLFPGHNHLLTISTDSPSF